jgi:epoxyqueuosine reductase QueG
MKQIDERNIMFARMTYEQNSEQYKDYYQQHPEKKEIDDRLRSMPGLLSEGTATYDPVLSKIPMANFDVVELIKPFCDGEKNPEKTELDSLSATELIKKLALHYGAHIVGVASMKEEHYYSVRGRTHYGEKVTERLPFAIAFGVEMDKAMVNRAPQMATMIESSNIYIKAGVIGAQISAFIRNLGYEARNHMDGNYLLVAPLVAVQAGLGEIGRHGLLLSPQYGARIRLGVVTTDLPLIVDGPVKYGLEELCHVCGLCVKTCPGKAIPSDRKMIDGAFRYQTDQEKCYEKWRGIGTDCGICLGACPVSQGLDPELLKQGKYDQIIADYKEKYGIRPYIKEAF